MQLWTQCLNSIRGEVNPQAFKTWFEPIRALHLEGKVLTIQVPNRFFYEWIEEHYIDVLGRALWKYLGHDGQLRYNIAKELSLPKQESPSPPSPPNDLSKHFGQIPLPRQHTQSYSNRNYNNYPSNKDQSQAKNQMVNPFVIPGLQKPKVEPQLNPEYTFENFIEGDCNRLARSAGMAISKRPGQTAFNPLVIYGNVGLGKTHLAHAVGNTVHRNHPEKTVLYVSCEQFTNQFIEALRNNAVAGFANFYQNIDLLIVDDIQFLSEKIKTQDIFFHIFNNLHQSGRQLIITSDRPPKELKGIEERLISRFKWGLSADLQQPSIETRMAIIQSKMQQDGVDLPYEVAEFISRSVCSNIREIEGILISMLAEAALNQREIDLALAKDVVEKFLNEPEEELSLTYIQQAVAEHYVVPLQDLIGKGRTKNIALARQVAMYLCKTLSKKSLKQIGQAFGGRDHSTVLHACRAIEQLMDNDQGFKALVYEIKMRVNAS